MKIFLETFGCQMNQYDSEIIRSILRSHQHTFVENLEQAEVALLNTCAIREHAHEKIYHRLDELKGRKRRQKNLIVAVLGCMAQNLRQELAEHSPIVDIVAGPDSYKRLPMLLDSVRETGEKGFDFSLSEYETYSDIAPQRLPGINAWIAIMRGCDNFCSFCVVPYTRGRERSRDPHNIVAETHRVAAEGFKQVTLLGQNVNSYRYEQHDFADLMQMVSEVPGIRRVRFTSPHPKDFPRRLLHTMAANPKLCKHIHLPLQAGSDAVLKRMNRTYTKQEFLDLVDEIREVMPEVSLTTDIICGFCGETDEDFEETLEVMRRVEFDSAFTFKYSQRKHTIAERKFKDDVPEEVKSQRLTRVIELQREISRKRNAAEIGKIYEVMVEEPSKKNPHEWLGRTDQNKGVVFSDESVLPADFVHVRINAAGTNTLRGTVERRS
ncbi:MAG: tRNA (N6-isopentenyl adenosine(37)-C2)-methylthiotransferase MiaB [candidate division KSB1 bacterium]|nr:tRNA (N6-isopentenyl adenosine(37)-C2)-methylthiotransferase MiaB [candidate division KSB1 bacterium]MDZ7302043.1 tRNA (N6-isopentenyl adenosine(37)-C2)-methylthiotransferase MiaB [candidate division KSB1 bacterium]MDZ7311085.1 tRNA (N6-isopentenyl adenosine(37)-C2)-methylthiotransferase MiaB [candidate division KSB1 bacterium]